jgi:hypothetical protein
VPTWQEVDRPVVLHYDRPIPRRQMPWVRGLGRVRYGCERG